MLGTRESRRLKGLYTLTVDDVLSASKFSYGIAKACFFIDFHDSPPGKTIPYDLQFKREHSSPAGDYYEIPYRCLLSEGVSALLAAGRCISADRPAMASLKVMSTCIYTGEEGGCALCRRGLSSRQAGYGRIKNTHGDLITAKQELRMSEKKMEPVVKAGIKPEIKWFRTLDS